MGMDWPHVHLLINHFPIILAVMGAVAVVLALIMRSRGVWLYAVASLTVMGLSAYPTLFTGEQADRVLHDPWYIVRGSIDRHEEAAELAVWIMIGTGLVAIYAWWRALKRDRDAEQSPVWLRMLILLGALGSVGTVSWASWLGGEIVHGSSILQGHAPAGLPPQPQQRPVND